MRTLIAFTKKEWMEQFRSGKIVILGILFLILGIMNPAIAKLTPWMLEMMADSLAESGMSVSSVVVDASTSWTQFFKNVPMGLIAFILLQSNIFTKEYQSGTLIPALTKGLARYKVVFAKTIIVAVLWSVCYWLCFGITYAYNDFYWDNGIMNNLIFSVVCWWIFGLWTVLVMVLYSAIVKSNVGVLVGTGGTVFCLYLISLVPKVTEYLPTMLMNTTALTNGSETADGYTVAIVVTIVTMLVCVISSMLLFNKKDI